MVVMMMIVLRNIHHATIVECFVKTCLRLLHLIVLVLILSNKITLKIFSQNSLQHSYHFMTIDLVVLMNITKLGILILVEWIIRWSGQSRMVRANPR